MNSGVYKLTNVRTGDFYIGASANLRNRFSNHKSRVRTRCCDSRAVRESFRSVREMRFEVIEECPVSELNARETAWIQKLNPSLNRHPFARCNRKPRRRRKLDPLVRFNLSDGDVARINALKTVLVPGVRLTNTQVATFVVHSMAREHGLIADAPAPKPARPRSRR